MSDVIMLTLIVVCFALTFAYVRLCDELHTPAADKDVAE